MLERVRQRTLSRVAARARGSVFGRGGRLISLAGVATMFAMVGAGLVTTAGSQAAPAKQCQGTPLIGGELQGNTRNQTGEPMKRTFVEHGPGTGFFGPAPAEEVRPGEINRWCVGSRLGVPAMKVTYRLPDGQEAHFGAYFKAVIGGLFPESYCSISDPRRGGPSYGCATREETKNCASVPGARGCGSGGEAIFRVFRQ